MPSARRHYALKINRRGAYRQQTGLFSVRPELLLLMPDLRCDQQHIQPSSAISVATLEQFPAHALDTGGEQFFADLLETPRTSPCRHGVRAGIGRRGRGVRLRPVLEPDLRHPQAARAHQVAAGPARRTCARD